MLTVTLPRKRNRFEEDEAPETTHKTLSKPPAEYDDQVEQVEEVESRFRRRALKLTKSVEQRLSRELFQIIEDWKDSRNGLREKLKQWNDLYEGVTDITNFPWEGACELHVPIPKIKAREIRSTINRTTMRPVPFLMARYNGPDVLMKQNKDFVKDVERFLEDKIKFDTNVHQTLKDAIIPTIRDGTCPVQVIWETELERVCDYKTYEDVEDFTEDYPDAESAGISEKEWNSLYQKIADGGAVEIQFEYDAVQYDGPKAYLVPLIDFVHYPVYVTEIESMLCHGKRIYFTDYQLKDLARVGKFSKEAVEKMSNRESDLREDGYTAHRDAIEGITRDRTRVREYECFELVYKTTLDPDSDSDTAIPQKYLITWAHKGRQILRIEKYPIRQGKTTYFPLRLIKRDNRFLGISLIDDISDISSEIDIHHRQRINSRTVTHVPSFKAKEGAKGRFDPARKDLQFRPGLVVWLEDTNDVAQFDIRPVDLSGSVEEEMLLYQLADLVTGSSSGLSGQNNPIDPRAPARKAQEQLRQSTNRIDDYVEVLLSPFANVGQFMLDLYYQYGPDNLTYHVEEKDGSLVEKEIKRSKFYNPNVKLRVTGTSVFVNPEQEYSRMAEIEAVLAQHPLTAQNARVRKESLVRLLDAGRVPDVKALTPTDEEIGLVAETTLDADGNPVTLIPHQQQVEADIKQKLQQEKLMARANESAAKRRTDVALKILDTVSDEKPELEESYAA